MVFALIRKLKFVLLISAVMAFWKSGGLEDPTVRKVMTQIGVSGPVTDVIARGHPLAAMKQVEDALRQVGRELERVNNRLR